MNSKEYRFSFDEFDSIDELSAPDAGLLKAARTLTSQAYAPYSGFKVAAVAILVNGKVVEGTNQENASYPVGICAERTLMSHAGTQFPGIGIETMAISYHDSRREEYYPISPCGMCRQFLQEFEERTKQPIRLILSGQKGKVYIVHQSNHLLPLAFTGKELKK